VALVLGVLAVQSASAQVQVIAAVENSEDIYVGQRFDYYIIIEGSDKTGNADITPLVQYDPQSTGTQNRSSSSITIVNGKRTRVETKQFIMTYQLLANQPGAITIPSVDVTIDGTIHTTNPVELQVAQPATTAKMDMEMSLRPGSFLCRVMPELS